MSQALGFFWDMPYHVNLRPPSPSLFDETIILSTNIREDSFKARPLTSPDSVSPVSVSSAAFNLDTKPL